MKTNLIRAAVLGLAILGASLRATTGQPVVSGYFHKGGVKANQPAKTATQISRGQ
jgi:hypothetical protein